MKKLLKMFGFGTALAASGLALADFYCNRCHKRHNGTQCPAVTLGFACEDPYGCGAYGCFNPGNYYACHDDGYDSDDEEDAIREAIQRRREHHERTIQRICNSINHIRNANDFRRVQDALNNRADQLGIRMNQPHFGCFDDGYGCQNFYGCHEFGCKAFYGCGYQ